MESFCFIRKKLEAAEKYFKEGNFKRSCDLLKEISQTPQIEKFPSFLCKVYSLLGECARNGNCSNYAEWLEYYAKCLSLRLNRFLSKQNWDSFFTEMAESGQMEIVIAPEDSSIIVTGGFLEKRKVISEKVEIILNITSFLPYYCQCNGLCVEFEITNVTNSFSKEIVKVQIDENIDLYPKQTSTIRYFVNVKDFTYKMAIKKCSVRFFKTSFVFEISKSKHIREITFNASTEGCVTSIEHPLFCVAGVKCPIRIKMKAGQNDTIFKLTTNNNVSKLFTLSKNETQTDYIELDINETCNYKFRIDWSIIINSMEASLMPTETIIPFVSPFDYKCTLYDQNGSAKSKDAIWKVEDEFTLVVELKAMLVTDIVIDDISDEGEFILSPFKKGVTLKKNECFTIVGFGKVFKNEAKGKIGNIQVYLRPKEFYTEPMVYSINLPQIKIYE